MSLLSKDNNYTDKKKRNCIAVNGNTNVHSAASAIEEPQTGRWELLKGRKSILDCMWGKRLAAVLAIHTGRGVALEVYLGFKDIRLHQVQIRLPILSLKPRGDATRSPKQGYQWPQRWTCVHQKL